MKTKTPRDPVAHAQHNDGMAEFNRIFPRTSLADTIGKALALLAIVGVCMALAIDVIDQSIR